MVSHNDSSRKGYTLKYAEYILDLIVKTMLIVQLNKVNSPEPHFTLVFSASSLRFTVARINLFKREQIKINSVFSSRSQTL